MKFLDPESRLYCATGKYTSLRGSLHSLWIGTGRGNRDISARSHGLHRVKLVPRRSEEASETVPRSSFPREDESTEREREREIRFATTPLRPGGNALSPGDILFVVSSRKCKGVEVYLGNFERNKRPKKRVLPRGGQDFLMNKWWNGNLFIFDSVVYFMLANGGVAIRVNIS